MYYELTDHFQVASDLHKTWEFFSTADNLPDITPPWLAFTMVTKGPVIIQNDALLDYTIRWLGVPIKWRTRIIDWSPPRQFIDLQLRGPYTLRHHQHTFTPAPDGNGTICTDRIIYKVPLPIIGRVMNQLVVRKQLIDIFQFRRKVIAERLGWVEAVQEAVEIRKLQ